MSNMIRERKHLVAGNYQLRRASLVGGDKIATNLETSDASKFGLDQQEIAWHFPVDGWEGASPPRPRLVLSAGRSRVRKFSWRCRRPKSSGTAIERALENCA
jgi:hypothetical protein